MCQEISHSRNDHGITAGLLKVAANYQDEVEKISRQGTREEKREPWELRAHWTPGEARWTAVQHIVNGKKIQSFAWKAAAKGRKDGLATWDRVKNQSTDNWALKRTNKGGWNDIKLWKDSRWPQDACKVKRRWNYIYTSLRCYCTSVRRCQAKHSITHLNCPNSTNEWTRI